MYILPSSASSPIRLSAMLIVRMSVLIVIWWPKKREQLSPSRSRLDRDGSIYRSRRTHHSTHQHHNRNCRLLHRTEPSGFGKFNIGDSNIRGPIICTNYSSMWQEATEQLLVQPALQPRGIMDTLMVINSPNVFRSNVTLTSETPRATPSMFCYP